MAKDWYNTLHCDDCGMPIGYYIDCGPKGSVICDDCYESEPDEDEDEDD